MVWPWAASKHKTENQGKQKSFQEPKHTHMQNLGGQWENTNYSTLRFYGVFISNHVNLITFLPHRALCYTETIIYLETKGPVLMVGWLVGKWTWEASTKRSLQKRWCVLKFLIYSTINDLCGAFDLSDVSHMSESVLFNSVAWVCLLSCVLFVVESCLKKTEWTLCIWYM